MTDITDIIEGIENNGMSLQERYTYAKRRIFERMYSALNREQREAVFTVCGPLLILAGAGSGKTTVLTQRIAFIIKYGNAYYSEAPSDLQEEYVRRLEEIASDEKCRLEELESAAQTFISNPCPSWAILAITFTNKAAAEMKSRLSRLLSENSDDSADCDVTARNISFCMSAYTPQAP